MVNVPFDPMDGCMQCKWAESNLGIHLDEMCDLHQRISDLQEDLHLERSVSASTSQMLREVSKAIGADETDDPVTLAKERMDEIAALEAENDGLRAAMKQEA